MVDPLGISPALGSAPLGWYEASALSQLAGALPALGVVGELLGGAGSGVASYRNTEQPESRPSKRRPSTIADGRMWVFTGTPATAPLRRADPAGQQRHPRRRSTPHR